VYHSLMYRGVDKRKYTSYLALTGLNCQQEVASICSIVTFVEVAMFVDVTSFKHSGVAMAMFRTAGILLV